jgi:sugar O-acyltransferase (sialic acid O-acetyltransferase NeuD family)
MSIEILIIGAGGHGRVLADALRAACHLVIGFLDPDPALQQTLIDGVPVLGDDELLENYSPETVYLANGIGSTSSTTYRTSVYERLTAAGYRFETVIHPSVTVATSVEMACGVQIMAGAVVQPGCSFGENTIINTGVIVDHDCIIGKNCHVAPGAILSGDVHVGDGCHIGVGARIIQGIDVGSNSMLAAGAVVIQDVPSGARVSGMPARLMENR